MDSPWRVPGRARARARLPVDRDNRDRKSKLLAEFETAPAFRIAASVTFAAIDLDLQFCFKSALHVFSRACGKQKMAETC